VLDTGIDNWRQVAASIATGGHVRGVAPRIEFNGMLSNGVKSGVFMGVPSILLRSRPSGSLPASLPEEISTQNLAGRLKPLSEREWPVQ